MSLSKAISKFTTSSLKMLNNVHLHRLPSYSINMNIGFKKNVFFLEPLNGLFTQNLKVCHHLLTLNVIPNRKNVSAVLTTKLTNKLTVVYSVLCRQYTPMIGGHFYAVKKMLLHFNFLIDAKYLIWSFSI